MNMKTRLKRATIGAMLALLVFGVGAFAQTPVDEGSAPVTVAALSGERALTLTGVDTGGVVGGGSVSLAFNENSLSAPFGVVVTDATYSRVGYQVDATLSDMYRVTPADGDDGFECAGTPIASSQFSVDFAGFSSLASSLQQDVEAVLKPTLTFVATAAELDTILTGILDVTSDGTVQVVGNTVTETLNGLSFMDVDDGVNASNNFATADAHPVCGGGGTPTPLVLQTGATQDPSLDSVADGLLSAGATVSEAITAGLLPPGADTGPDGSVWLAAESLLIDLIGPLLVTDALVDDLVADLNLQGIGLDVLGQSGAYANVPRLNLADGATDVATGLYHGVLTVTLTDVE